METKDLRDFLVVYENKSITKAAASLYVTTQGLSKRIKKLEKELAVPLFTRTPHGLQPTLYADTLKAKTESIIAELDSLKNAVQQGVDNRKVLKVAAVYGVMAYLTLDFIHDFRAAHPNIQLNIMEGPDTAVDSLLWNEVASVGFLAGPLDTTKYDAVFFTSHKHCLVINQSHPLAQKERISYEDLRNEPLALEGREFKPYHNNMNRFLKAGVVPNVVFETSEISFIHEIAHMNKGIGISVDYPAFSNPFSNTVIKPFADETCTWDTYLVTKHAARLSPEAQAFHAFALQWLKENQPKLFKWPSSS